MFRSNVLVCGGTGCTSSNSEQIIERLKEEIKAQGLEKEVNVIRTGCFGLCALGPIMVVYPEGAFYSRVTPEDVPEIVSEHLLKGRIVKRLLYQETVVDDNTTKSLNETTFYAKQMRIALRNCGVINPENIDEYIAQDVYKRQGQAKVDIDPDRVDIILRDQGPGIADVEQAMQAGWSTAPDNVRALGFGAGMGLPNMKKYSDEMRIDSVVGEGTTVYMTVFPGRKEEGR